MRKQMRKLNFADKNKKENLLNLMLEQTQVSQDSSFSTFFFKFLPICSDANTTIGEAGGRKLFIR